ncbi:tetratricopeptide repeat protein [Candidatus Parcubacteria bacterium]|nr:tetratricopeptide repeat protein [Candidatus Parcubacteria bacterium]
MSNVLNRILRGSIYSLVFLLPLFFLPFSFEAFEINKQYLLSFLVSIALFAWLAKMVVVDKEIRFRRTPLDLPILAFLVIAVFSAIFSVDKMSSLFGFYGKFSDGLIGLLSLGALYFLITNNGGLNLEKLKVTVKSSKLKDKGNIDNSSLISVQRLLKAFLASGFFVMLISYLSILGVWGKISLITNNLSLSQIMSPKTFNPIAGSLEALAMFVAVLTVLSIGLLLCSLKGLKQIKIWLLLILGLGILLIVDFSSAWLVLLITLVLFLAMALTARIFKENVNRLLVPIFFIIIAVVGLNADFSGVMQEGLKTGPLVKEEVLDQGTSWKIGFNTVTDNLKNGAIGSGIGTFFHDFSMQKPVEFNESRFWQIRFDRPGSHIVEILSTIGILGMLAYLSIIGFFLLISLVFLKSIKSQISNNLTMPLLMTFLALFIGQLLYYQNTTLAFTFWLVLAIAVVSWQSPVKEKKVSFENFPEMSLVLTSCLIIFGLGILGSFYFGQKFYRADMKYSQAVQTGIAVNTDLLEEAKRLNPHFSQYRVVLARFYLSEVLAEAMKPGEKQNVVLAQEKIKKCLDEAKMASEISPNSVVAWETLGVIYRDIRGMVTGSLEWAEKSFNRAIELEPNNPILYTELGKIYLGSEKNNEARESFRKGEELKSNYIGASLQIVLMEEREENIAGAIAKLEGLAGSFPLNTEVLFQLGRLYFNQDRVNEAISQFERVVDLVPNHSNAHYSLGVAYSSKGEKAKAIAEFEKVLELNPDNEDVRDKIRELRE